LSVPVVWLKAADVDLEAILDHIEQESLQAALAMALVIRKGADVLLRDHPKAGRTGRRRGTRELVMAGTPFIVIYRVRFDQVEILRVLHGKQKWPA
jgi:toxin ParE1/3/4